MKKKMVFLLFLGVSLLAIVAIAFSGLEFYRRARQVRTFADMQVIARRLDAAIAAGQRSLSALRHIVKSVNDGKDAWGHDLVLEIRVGAQGSLDYLLISKGSDGKLDKPDPVQYFAVAPMDVRRRYSRDIVFCNGLAVTVAGK